MTSRLESRNSLCLLVLAGGLGCGGDDFPPAPEWASTERWQAWHDCEDSSCRETIVREAFHIDPAQAAHWLELIPATEEQLALVQVLVTEDPAKAGQLCPVIQMTEAREACQRNTSRPHLYAPPPRNQNQPSKRTAEGPEQTTLILPPNPGTRLSQLGSSPGTCGSGPTARACLMSEAVELAHQDKGQEAARRCMAIEGEESWRGDCHFQAAEALAQAAPIESYGVIADLCRSSGQWAGRCVDKVNTRMAQLAPPSTASATEWEPSLQAAQAIRTAWAAEGPVIRDRVLMGFWAASLARAYTLSTQVTGNPIDHLPPEALPHIRAGAAWLYVKQAPASSNVETLAAGLFSALSQRSDGPTSESGRPLKSPVIKDLWETDRDGDGEVAATLYMGTARRAVSTDLDSDLQICILEAAIRQGDRWNPLLQAAQNSPDRTVSWTARRVWNRLQNDPSFKR